MKWIEWHTCRKSGLTYREKIDLVGAIHESPAKDLEKIKRVTRESAPTTKGQRT